MDDRAISARRELARRELARRGGGPQDGPQSQIVQPDQVVDQPQEGQQNASSGALDAFTKGQTFGLGPLLTAGEAAIVGRKPGGGTFDIGNFEGTFEERFDDALKAERGQNEQFRQGRPGLSLASELSGGISTLITAPGANLVKFGKTGGQRIAAGAAEGATIGAGFAAGEGEDLLEGALLGGALGAGGGILIKGIQKVAGGVANFARGSNLLAKSPTLQQLRQKTSKLYESAKSSGIRFKEDFFSRFSEKLDITMKQAGARKALTPKTIAVLNEIRAVKGTSPDFQEMDELRRVAAIAAGSIEPVERRLGKMIIDEIDELVETGSSSLGGTAKKARKLWGRVRRDELIASSIEKARRNTSGLPRGLKVEFKKIVNDPKKSRGFSKEEISAMNRIIDGTGTSNTLRAIGMLGFNPSKNVPNVLGGGIGAAGGAAVGGIPGAVVVQGTAIASRAGAEALASRNAQVLGAMVRSGLPEGKIRGVAKALERIGSDEKAFQVLLRSINIGGVSASR